MELKINEIDTEKNLMNDADTMELSFVSIPGNEILARVCVTAFVSKLNPTVDEIADIKTAVSEAVTNAVLYAYKEPGKVVLRCSIEDRTLYMEIEDYGIGIEDIELAMQPFYTTSKNEERSGMGFTLMQAFMDELKVYSTPNKGTKLCFKKILHE